MVMQNALPHRAEFRLLAKIYDCFCNTLLDSSDATHATTGNYSFYKHEHTIYACAGIFHCNQTGNDNKHRNKCIFNLGRPTIIFVKIFHTHQQWIIFFYSSITPLATQLF